jgi:hypothetical protein
VLIIWGIFRHGYFLFFEPLKTHIRIGRHENKEKRIFYFANPISLLDITNPNKIRHPQLCNHPYPHYSICRFLALVPAVMCSI